MRLVVARNYELTRLLGDSGKTLYEHLAKARDDYGFNDPRLEDIPVAKCGEWVLAQFYRLSKRRDRSPATGHPMPLSYAQIETLERLNRVPFTQFELNAIEEMDAALLEAASKT